MTRFMQIAAASILCLVSIDSDAAKGKTPTSIRPAEDPVAQFQKIIGRAEAETNKATPVYFNDAKQAWAKRRFSIENLKYDVKKTDSLLNPVIAVVDFTLRYGQSALLRSEEEAEATTAIELGQDSFAIISLRYFYQDDAWLFADGNTSTIFKGLGGRKDSRYGPYPISIEDISAKPNSIPNAALQFWLPK